ncbi:TIGR03915 family putative DNA repair protein [Pedobacter montanisoli]|uniref:TIGR03915 family putative DNA repair protein n=1 Tax=Pedobacter montanisoli TaxID=2923277 RepID=A0ABS9ZWY6_9SPHI|nr:TIGR03915 family putative DNA repair protein [Pedobacter montanisoli]MCJ0742797.1 TIGR03915 family putative DNA repair protein [Pedobacter montanisoli]
MECKVLEYDGSWYGLLTLIFEVYEYKYEVSAIINHQRAELQSDFFAQNARITTNQQKAERVMKGLKAKTGAQGLTELYEAYLSEIKGVEMLILKAVQYYFSLQQAGHKNYAHPQIIEIKKIVKSVSRERHRMKAFVRFQRLSDGIYFALVEPDFNVLPLIVKHFKERYADQQWIIYDGKRNYGISYDLHEVNEVIFGEEDVMVNQKSIANGWHEEEAFYGKLWNLYFKSVNIKERKNTKLHMQHVPKRYWKYLNEKL